MHRCNCTHDTWPTIMFRANVCFVVDSITVLFFNFFFARKFTMVTWHVSRGHMTWVVFQWKLTIYPSHYICINRVICWIKKFGTCSPSSVQFLILLLEVFIVLWWKKGGGKIMGTRIRINWCKIGQCFWNWNKVNFFPLLNFVNVNEGDIKYIYSLWCCEGYPLKVLVWNMLVIVIKAVEWFLCHTGGIFCQIYFSCFFYYFFFAPISGRYLL